MKLTQYPYVIRRNGASGETRTPTGLPLEPKSSASTNFATLADNLTRNYKQSSLQIQPAMTTHTKRFARIGLILLLITNTATATHQTQLEQGWVEFADGYRIAVELATTASQREYGLMNRISMPEDRGMLFVYPVEIKQAMWMKNMLLELDVIFIAESGQIVSLLYDIPPCKSEPCPVYKPTENARYMLEVNAGFVAKRHLTTGQSVIIDYRHDPN
jgi:uncharacterized protein